MVGTPDQAIHYQVNPNFTDLTIPDLSSLSLSLEICIQRQGREREGTIEARGMGGIGKPKLLHTNPLEG